MFKSKIIQGTLFFFILSSNIVLFLPSIDRLMFSLLNGHLEWMPLWYQKFFSLFNHRWESVLNIVFMITTIILAAPSNPHRKKIYWSFILGSVCFYEIFFQLFVKLDRIGLLHRSSPSLSFPFVDLSLFDPGNIKVYSNNSFPSGHAMIFGFWSSLSALLFQGYLRKSCILMSYLLCLPRLVAGAHWFSDVLAGYLLGDGIFNLYRVLQSSKKLELGIEEPCQKI